jgi:hypothetical protein
MMLWSVGAIYSVGRNTEELGPPRGHGSSWLLQKPKFGDYLRYLLSLFGLLCRDSAQVKWSPVSTTRALIIFRDIAECPYLA